MGKMKRAVSFMTKQVPYCILALSVLSLSAQTDVLTQHNNAARTGANLKESILKPGNVNAGSFGKLFEIPVDGFVYAQPLVISGIQIKGKRNVLYVATEHNTVYAFDADTGEKLWDKNYGPSMPTPSSYFKGVTFHTPYHDLNPEIGITATPVIDRETQTLYFTSYTQEGTREPYTFHHYLHAVSLLDGSEKFLGPAEIVASMYIPPRTGMGAIHQERYGRNPYLPFVPLQHMQRPGLVLVKPPGGVKQVILTFASHGDYFPYHGWVISYEADDLRKQLRAWASNSDPIGGAGIWQAGNAPAVDEQNGSFYMMLGNGQYFYDPPHGDAFGNSFLRFNTSQETTMGPTDSFTPCNRAELDAHDDDLGSSGPLLLIEPYLPHGHYVTGVGKQGRVYLLDKDKLGGRQSCVSCGGGKCDPQVLQEFQAVRSPSDETQHVHGGLVFWTSAEYGPVVYVWGENDHLRAYPLQSSGNEWSYQTFWDDKTNTSTTPTWAVSQETSPAHPWMHRYMMTGGMLSISANNDQDGIVWTTTPYNNDANMRAVPGILRAYNANDLSKELWNSYQNAEDDFGNFSKFTPVTVANGKVYVPTFSGRVSVYGLRTRRENPTRRNLLENGGFEEGMVGWAGTPNHFSSQIKYPYHGHENGVLCTTQVLSDPMIQDSEPSFEICPTTEPHPVNSRLSQTVIAPASGDYTLRAYCATNILPDNPTLLLPHNARRVLLGVDISSEGITINRVVRSINAWVGYQLYEIKFKATQGQKIKVWYSAPGVNTPSSQPRSNAEELNQLIDVDAWATIDDVELWGPAS